ncbi:ornithine carbamoyltransferase [Pelomonas saccharophila]|uniref:Ornithine carbamoyltransferase n=1 Tax=Roseateles saccharophilus TaxID=304 RepID=A0ABU1YN17_ROSSA|nr:ornithine carbamoyltransferase [Roseateles saccharophilus]MDR7270252.1 ornithine carbamoyltransferase [Roseateles saccharophilus]
MCSKARQGATSAEFSSPEDAAALVRQAQALHQLGDGGPQLLQGKKFALVSPRRGEEGEGEFLRAATALGAHVSCVQLGLDENSSAQQIATTARLLARLYDAVECQHLPAALVGQIASSSTIPVFAGLATREHPTAALVNALGVDAPPTVRRHVILQAALLLSIR